MFRFPTYTVESVTSGHPDKVCDQISDAVLDACLREDPASRVAVEVMGMRGMFVLAGEVTTRAKPDFIKIAENIYRDVGYDGDLEIIERVVPQSPDIAQGVDTGGAGDQGIMYGFADSETEEFLPKGIVLAHALAKGLEDLRKSGKIGWLRPDGKTQVTVEEGRVTTILVSSQHKDGVLQDEIKETLVKELIRPIAGGISGVKILVNPTGSFVSGGFEADVGLTGRKIMVDTYGGLLPHGGGCFSGKDPTKVDRSAAYMARFAAKNLVANNFAKKCLVTVAYAIGVAEPLMVEAINEKGENLGRIVREKFDFRPRAIIERLDLRRPIYRGTAAYGHFGKPDLPWEEIVNV